MKKRIMIFVLAVVFMFLFCFSAASAEEPVNIQFVTWLADPLFDEMITEFEGLHPEIKVELIAIPTDSYITKLAVMLAGSNPPDLGWQFERVATSWTEMGAFSDISELETDPEYNYVDLAEKPQGLWKKGNTLYGVPFSTAPFFVAYNKDLYEKAGLETPTEAYNNGEWTWERFAADAKAIDDLDNATYGFLPKDNLMKSNPWMNIMPAIWAYGGSAWDSETGECKLNSPETIEALSIYQKMFVEGGIVPFGEEVMFSNNNVGLYICQLGGLKNFTDVNYGIVPTPAGPAGFYPAVGQAGMVVFNNSRHKAEAIEFFKFFTGSENSKKLAMKFPQIRQSVLDTDIIYDNYPTVPRDEMKTAVVDSIISGTVLPSHENFEKIDLTLQPFFERVWNGEDITTELTAACEAIAPFLTK